MLTMELAETILLMLLVATSLALIGLILLQQGKGADMGAAFGSGSASGLFGSAGAGGFLTRITTWLAVLFFGITFALAYIAKEKAGSFQDLSLPSLSQGSGTASDLPAGLDAVEGAENSEEQKALIEAIRKAAENSGLDAQLDIDSDLPIEAADAVDAAIDDVPDF